MNKELQEILIGIKRAVQLLNRNEKRNLLLATGIMAVTGMLTNLPAVILGRLVDSITASNSVRLQTTWQFLALIIFIIVLREGLTVLRKYLIENIATQTDKEQTVQVIERLLKTDITSFLQKQQIGALHGRIFRSMQGLIKMLKLTFLDFAPTFFTALAAVSIALFQKPLVATVMVLVIPSGLFLIIKQVSSQKGIRVHLLRGKEQVDGKVVEMLGGIETIRVLNTVSQEVKKVERIAEKQRAIEIRHHIMMALFDSAKYLNEGFFYIVVIILSLVLSAYGIITRGDILVYSILFLSITGPLREIHRILDQAHESSLRVNDLYALLHQPLDHSYRTQNASKTDWQTETAVLVENLSFSYGQSTDLIDKVTVRIQKGEKIGIAGASGCGKTTFLHILLKLLHGYHGSVSMFGQDLSTMSREDIAEHIAYVSQTPFIFSGTIHENMIYGVNRQIEKDALIVASKKANIFEEIEERLGGFGGKVAENGSNLSGGQKQRLALARIFLMDPELLIFDEATSALDNTNEATIQKNIEETFEGRTMITIAHRLTTLKNCDRILVFDKGKIEQEGSFEHLAHTKGLFQDFLEQKKDSI